MPKMANTASTPPKVVSIQTNKLSFDARNPRIVELARSSAGVPSQDEILQVLWREFAVDEIAISIANNDYFQHEPLFVALEAGTLVVIEGNRRLAAVRLLTDPQARLSLGATDLPRIGDARRQRLLALPAIMCKRNEIWQYVGFKHVNGPQVWQSFAKAEYIAWVHNKLNVSLDQIAKNIGDQHATVRRLYRAYMALEQVEAAGVFSRTERYSQHFSFSHLYTGLDYGGIQKFTGVSGEKSYTKKPIPPAKTKEFGELCVWLYGSKTKNKQPLVRSQNPDLRLLDEVLTSKDGIAALRRGLPLQVSLDISKGDDRLFREALIAAKQSLQEARGRLLTGYAGEGDLLESAQAIRDLAVNVHKEMTEIYDTKRTRRATRAAR